MPLIAFSTDFVIWRKFSLIPKASMTPLTFIWTPDKINAHFVIGFVSFTLMRMLQAKLDFQFSMEQIGTSLQRYNCVQIAGNIYQFTYYDMILDACEKALGLELHNKYRSQLQIRRLLRY